MSKRFEDSVQSEIDRVEKRKFSLDFKVAAFKKESEALDARLVELRAMLPAPVVAEK